MREKPWMVQAPALAHRMLLETGFYTPQDTIDWAQLGLEQNDFIESLPLIQRLLAADAIKFPALLSQISGPILDSTAFGWITGHLLEGWAVGDHPFSRVMDGLKWVNDELESGKLTLGEDLTQPFAAEPYSLTELVNRYEQFQADSNRLKQLEGNVDEFLMGYAE